MCFPTFTALGSLLLLCSFILELFIMIGNLSNRQFLKVIYFLKMWNQSQNQSYQFGLWNYCTGDASGALSSCGSHTAAYNWATTPTVSNLAPNQATSGVVRGLFLGMFILFFIGCGFSFVFWLLSIPICCLKRRSHGYSMSTLVFINFLVMLVALILALIVILSGVKAITNNGAGWNAEAGNALWLTIGAVVALFLSFLCFTGGSICGPRRSKGAVNPNYKDSYGGSNTNYMSSPMFVPTGQQTNMANEAPGQSTVLQQPYMMSPNMRNQRTNAGMDNTLANQQHGTGVDSTLANNQQYGTGVDSSLGNQQYSSGVANTATDNNYDPNSVSVPMHGYQTPTLQASNTPR